MKTINDVTILNYKGYYYLWIVIEGKNYLGRPCSKLGWIVYTIKSEVKDALKKVKEKAWTYNDVKYPPFTQKEIDKFFSMSQKKLQYLKEQSKQKTWITN